MLWKRVSKSLRPPSPRRLHVTGWIYLSPRSASDEKNNSITRQTRPFRHLRGYPGLRSLTRLRDSDFHTGRGAERLEENHLFLNHHDVMKASKEQAYIISNWVYPKHEVHGTIYWHQINVDYLVTALLAEQSVLEPRHGNAQCSQWYQRLDVEGPPWEKLTNSATKRVLSANIISRRLIRSPLMS